MSSWNFWKCVLFFLTFYCASLITSTTANAFTDSCINSTQPKSTRCIGTYGELYNTLASQDNRFKLESALYPPMRPSSVLVKVTLYGLNGTEKTTPVYYTWSLLCLYVALPAKVLELLSLGSILISSRTQELSISVPLFCCSVPITERERNIKHVLAALQDLAVSPGVTDPRLNSAECVVGGHKFIRLFNGIPEMDGHRSFVRGMLWTSLLSTLLASPLLADFLEKYITEVESPENKANEHEPTNGARELQGATQQPSQQLVDNKMRRKSKRLLNSLKFTFVLLLVTELIIFFLVLIPFSVERSLPTEMFIALLLNLFENIFMYCCCRGRDNLRCTTVLVLLSCNPTIYHFCWLVIGIMINPAWGLSILLVITLICIVITLAAYVVLFYNNDTITISCLREKTFWICLLGVIAFGLFVATMFLASKSYYGSNGADEWVRLVLWSAISFVLSYVFIKKEKEKSEARETVLNTDGPSGTPQPGPQ